MGGTRQGPEPPAGNLYNKYATRNPVARRLIAGFLAAYREMIDLPASPPRCLEVGCGEGHLLGALAQRHEESEVHALDLYRDMARQAREQVPAARLVAADAEKLPYREGLFDLVVCCEVLEHLPHPEASLAEIHRILRPGGILVASVPREPLWRLLNMARGAYLRRLGNTPGHLQHFGRRGFLHLLEAAEFAVERVRTPVPWTFARARRADRPADATHLP